MLLLCQGGSSSSVRLSLLFLLLLSQGGSSSSFAVLLFQLLLSQGGSSSSIQLLLVHVLLFQSGSSSRRVMRPMLGGCAGRLWPLLSFSSISLHLHSHVVDALVVNGGLLS